MTEPNADPEGELLLHPVPAPAHFTCGHPLAR